MPNLVGLDLGTTTVTGVLLDAERAEVLHLVQLYNDAALESPRPTRTEQDPRRLRALSLEILAELAAVGASVDGVALTGQKHGLLGVDTEGRPLTPLISWQDQRTAEPLPGGVTTLDHLASLVSDLDWEENGCRIRHGYGAATLFWLVQQFGLPAEVHRVCTIADWLAGQLAGCLPATDPTLAASWGVYDLVRGGWNAAFLDRLGLDAGLFPPIRISGVRLGGLAPEVAHEIGLPAGLPIFNALGDTQASFLGSLAASAPLIGVTFSDHPIFLNLGTGGQICWRVPSFEPPNEKVETRPLPGGQFLRVGASLCGGAAYAWLNRAVRDWLAEFGMEVEEESVYERLNALAAACEDTADLRVRTTFLGMRGDPSVQAGAIEGITLDNLRLDVLARATLIGLVDELRALYQVHGGKKLAPSHVIATGGAVHKTPLLPSLIEERFGLPVVVPLRRETAALGAAVLAAQAL